MSESPLYNLLFKSVEKNNQTYFFFLEYSVTLATKVGQLGCTHECECFLNSL